MSGKSPNESCHFTRSERLAQHYSVNTFFRQMPNELLERYFSSKGLLNNLDFANAKDKEVFTAWLTLANIQRGEIEPEFQEIFELSCEKGLIAIIDEAEFQLTEEELARFKENMSALPGHFERAMTTFLDFNSCWKGAKRFYHADNLPHWRKRIQIPRRQAAVDAVSLVNLATRTSEYFHQVEGRGNNCWVEKFRRGKRQYYFLFQEDYSQRSTVWQDGGVSLHDHKPVFEIVFVYSEVEGSLDLNCRGTRKVLVELQKIFCSVVLGLTNYQLDPKVPLVYDLSRLLSRNFDFTYAVGSGIVSVRVKRLRLTSRNRIGDRVTLEVDTSRLVDAVYDLVDRLRTSMELDIFDVTQVDLTVLMVAEPNGPPRQFPIRITHPDTCSLKHDGVDLKLRSMLIDSGIEPQEAAEA